MKPAHWVLDGEIIDDAGDIGGDIQIGPAIQVRFRSDECPEARFDITVYATATPYSDLRGRAPACTHGKIDMDASQYVLDEHLACDWKPGTVDVQEQVTYRMNGRMVNGFYESDDTDPIFYSEVGNDLGYTASTLAGQLADATRDAHDHIKDWVEQVNTYMHWDGRTKPVC